MTALFLFGGGDREGAYVKTYWPFIEAATVAGERRIAIVAADCPGLDKPAKEAACRSPFALFGLRKEQLPVLFVSRESPLDETRLAALEPTGLFVAGGITLAYHDGLCADQRWLRWLQERGLPYAGFSAGAMVAASRAIVGGWKVPLLHSDVLVTHPQYAEGLEYLEVREGLGLVPFSVEPHATHWGTVTRLMQAVHAGLAPSGWAIDEDCMLWIQGDELRVRGPGSAYRVRRNDAGMLDVGVFRAGTLKNRSDW